ncbi:MAG TPA: serine hydrolase domain-containing protein [Mycobacteriales bacterium]|nr:serine hydrolase domain-containing protein [Mycobacteriales bacterium]
MSATDQTQWQTCLDELLTKHEVAGAALGILHRGELLAVSAGHANLSEGIEATPDTLFQIGSITKTWTATLILQLVDEGKLTLSDRAVDVVPDLVLPDPAVTIEQLLNHTSGLEGDHFLDTGRGDDCLQRYAASLAAVAQIHPNGATWSYCNSGFSLLGRIIEVIDGRTWDLSLRERLVEPLRMTRTVTLPEEALRFRTATGHVRPAQDEPLQGVAVWGITRSAGPAGLVSASVADLLAFARLHLDGGLGPDGTTLLSPASAAAMVTPTVDCTERWLLGAHQGLSWFLDTWSGQPTWSHGGSTLGQNAYLRLLPESELAVALLTNGGGHATLADELITEVLRDLAGVTPPAKPRPAPGQIADPARFLGHYRNAGQSRRIVLNDDDQLVIEGHDHGPAAEVASPTVTGRLHPFEDDVLLAEFEGIDLFVPISFLTIEGQDYLHALGRISPKID